jgi:hypothetical protein
LGDGQRMTRTNDIVHTQQRAVLSDQRVQDVTRTIAL